jgi:hypothetical protein
MTRADREQRARVLALARALQASGGGADEEHALVAAIARPDGRYWLPDLTITTRRQSLTPAHAIAAWLGAIPRRGGPRAGAGGARPGAGRPRAQEGTTARARAVTVYLTPEAWEVYQGWPSEGGERSARVSAAIVRAQEVSDERDDAG